MGQSSAEVLLHLRRLDRFLRSQGLHSAAHTLEMDSMAYLDAAYLQRLVREGRWDAAWCYLRRFSPLFYEDEGEGASQPYNSLLHTLQHHAMLAFLSCHGDEAGRAVNSLYPRPPDTDYRNKFPEMAQQIDLYRSMASAQARASVNWEHMKRITVEKLHELLHMCPGLECSSRMRLPRRTPTLADIIPLGMRDSRRHQRKKINRKSARELAHFLLKKRLPSVQKINHSGDSGIPSTTVLQPTLASEANMSGICLSVASTDDYSTGNAHQAFDPTEALTRLQTVGRCWPVTDGECGESCAVLEKEGSTPLNSM